MIEEELCIFEKFSNLDIPAKVGFLVNEFLPHLKSTTPND